MKKICIVLLFATLMCIGCSAQPKSQLETPPYCEQVCEMLGQEVETVITKIGLSADDFVYEDSSYWYNNSVEFCGYTFRMRITPYRTEQGDLVQGIGYVLEYSNAPENAAKAVIDLRNTLSKGNLDLVEPNPSGNNKLFLKEITQTELTGKFAGADWDAGLCWILSTNLDAIPQNIIEANAPTCISLRYWVSYLSAKDNLENGSETVIISIEYGLTSDYIKQNTDGFFS